MRTFDIVDEAKREASNILFGLIGASGSGKTYSALEIATGLADGGRVVVIDTEEKRSLHYAGKFRFSHLPFAPPFSPDDYIAALTAAKKLNPAVIIIDSMTHEHEGVGGVLEFHDEETQRLAKAWNAHPDKVKMSAWIAPKRARTRLIGEICRAGCHVILCFRAKEKTAVKDGGKPVALGWMPIGGDEFLYEMTVTALLPPGSKGHPMWMSKEIGEKQFIKRPEILEGIVTDGRLSQDLGAKLRLWAKGGVDLLIAKYEACTAETLPVLESERQQMWSTLDAKEKAALKYASDNAKEKNRARTPQEPTGSQATE